MGKKRKLFIRNQVCMDKSIEFEPVMAEEIGSDLAIAKSLVHNRWIIFDIKSGLFVITCTTKKKCLEKFYLKEKERNIISSVHGARMTPSYQKRVKEMEDYVKSLG